MALDTIDLSGIAPSALADIQAGDLYALLASCSDEDLAPLVEVITGRMTNFLDVAEEYKAHHPQHSKYHRLIGDELRRFGGNSFRNILRGGEGPPYDEILVDVCKKLDVPHEKGNTLKNESNLLTVYFERQWKLLSDEQKAEVMAEARKGASKQINKRSIAQTGVLFALTRLHPIGWGALVFELAEPAFRITVPCVLHIAYLRKKVLEGQVEAPQGVIEAIARAAAEPASLLQADQALHIGASEDNPVLALMQVADPGPREWKSVDDKDGSISRLSPLLQAVPMLATAVDVVTHRYMHVVANGELARAADRSCFRAVVVKGGQIVENAKLFDAASLTDIVSAGSVFQLVSVAVAQKHLADISHKLDTIKAATDRIQHFQTQSRRAVLTGAIRYFGQVAQSVLDGELSDSIRLQIETHESKLLEVQDHLLEDIRHETGQIMNVKDGDMFGSKGMEEAIRAHQKLLDDLYQQFLLCIRARACGWQLLVVFPGEERLKENRKRDIRSALAMLDEGGDLLRSTESIMRDKIRGLSSVWNNNLTLNERKLALLSWNDTLLDQVVGCRRQIDRDLEAAEAFMAELRQPANLLLKVEGERIVGMCPA